MVVPSIIKTGILHQYIKNKSKGKLEIASMKTETQSTKTIGHSKKNSKGEICSYKCLD